MIVWFLAFVSVREASKVCAGHGFDFEGITPVPPVNKLGRFARTCLGCVPCLRHRMEIGDGNSSLSSKVFILVEGFVQVLDSTQDVLFYRELVRVLVGIGRNTSVAIAKTDKATPAAIVTIAHTTIYVPLVRLLATFNAYFAPVKESIRNAVAEAILLQGLMKARDELQGFVMGANEDPDSIMKNWCSIARLVQQVVSDTLISMGSVIQQETSGLCVTAFCRFACRVKGATAT